MPSRIVLFTFTARNPVLWHPAIAPLRATHFLMNRLPNFVTGTALHVLAYNLTRVMDILGVRSL